jgi:hypothetical protein
MIISSPVNFYKKTDNIFPVLTKLKHLSPRLKLKKKNIELPFKPLVLDETFLKEKLKSKKPGILLRASSVCKSPDNRDYVVPIPGSFQPVPHQLIGTKINFQRWVYTPSTRAKAKADSTVYADF